ncbi:putative eka-like protein [Erysiphe necator]|uniref:Putative eka-like protein n=1 Tax=Uncinula necator TaxID=52586 RepID=A0A0B1PD29_UNCNE|nr:putative eka-like protein [Erysiphe necator]
MIKLQTNKQTNHTTRKPANSKSSPSRGAGINAQHALHVWDSQKDSQNPSPQDLHPPAGTKKIHTYIQTHYDQTQFFSYTNIDNYHSANKSIFGRPILKPIAPSKRPTPDRIPQDRSESTDMENAFLPKKLAKVIATRQLCERAWHVRVMICNTILSNIDSTLAKLTEGLETEDAEAFKAYLRVAISNFVAAESSPSPPSVPMHTRPDNGNGKEKGKEKGKEIERNLAKKVAIATPRIILSEATNQRISKEVKLPMTPLSIKNSWATVAHNGQKKARVTLCNNAQAASSWKATQCLFSNHKSTKAAPTDKRFLVRLSLEHELRKLL